MTGENKLAFVLAICVGCILLMATSCKAAEFYDQSSYKHFAVSGVLGVGSGAITGEWIKMKEPTTRRLTALGMCMVPGVGKELYDHYSDGGSGWSESDLAFDAIGCVLGIATYETLTVMARPDGISVAGRF